MIQNSWNKPKTYQCWKCDEGFDSPKSLAEHEKIHLHFDNRPKKDTIQCDVIKDSGEKQEIHRCKECNEYFNCSKSLSKHEKIHLTAKDNISYENRDPTERHG